MAKDDEGTPDIDPTETSDQDDGPMGVGTAMRKITEADRKERREREARESAERDKRHDRETSMYRMIILALILTLIVLVGGFIYREITLKDAAGNEASFSGGGAGTKP